jgi:hypothetical protein
MIRIMGNQSVDVGPQGCGQELVVSVQVLGQVVLGNGRERSHALIGTGALSQRATSWSA